MERGAIALPCARPDQRADSQLWVASSSKVSSGVGTDAHAAQRRWPGSLDDESVFTPASFRCFRRRSNGEPVRLCKRDDHAIERIPAKRWQASRRTCDTGIQGDSRKSYRSTTSEEPLERRVPEPELTRSRLDGHLPGADDRYVSLRRLPELPRRRLVVHRLPVPGARMYPGAHSSHVSGHSSSVRARSDGSRAQT